ncbi:MAG: magnesium transporter [Pirellulales bacterium]|nr:magnesium transporter [Pirellulales bacterium]
MTNTLYLPELREMLAENNTAELHEFCTALHPARTAEFMEGLTAEEAWAVLQHADMALRAEIFGFFEEEKQVEIIERTDPAQIAPLIAEMPPDDRVDLLAEIDPEIVEQLMPMIPTAERRDILRLSAYPEGTAGAEMTTEFARLDEQSTVHEAINEVRRKAEELETIYYLYAVDQEDHLRGLISFRQLLTAKPNTKVGELMERDIVTANATDDREDVAEKVERYDLLAIPVVDDEYRLVGIITHDDVIDVVREEAVEDAYRSVAVAPLTAGYLETGIWTLSWKRGIWLAILFVEALFTTFALRMYDWVTAVIPWLILFIPLLISTGGNTGNQSATLVITAMSTGNITLRDWWRVVRRELCLGFMLGSVLGLIGFVTALGVMSAYPAQKEIIASATMVEDSSKTTTVGKETSQDSVANGKTPLADDQVKPNLWSSALVVAATLFLLVPCGTLCGAVLPLVFRRLGLDPALMSNPVVASMIDVMGIVIYMNVAIWMLL